MSLIKDLESDILNVEKALAEKKEELLLQRAIEAIQKQPLHNNMLTDVVLYHTDTMSTTGMYGKDYTLVVVINRSQYTIPFHVDTILSFKEDAKMALTKALFLAIEKTIIIH